MQFMTYARVPQFSTNFYTLNYYYYYMSPKINSSYVFKIQKFKYHVEKLSCVNLYVIAWAKIIHFISCSQYTPSSMKNKTLLYQLKAQDILIYGDGYPKLYFRLCSIARFLYKLQPHSPTWGLENEVVYALYTHVL